MLTSRRLATQVPRSAFQRCRRSSTGRPFCADDPVLLKSKSSRTLSPIFVERLRAGGRLDTNRGSIAHDDIIGKHKRDVVLSKFKNEQRKAQEYRLTEVRLDDYVTRKRRLVTPIYPQDSQVIVSLLDLHPDPASEDAEESSDGRIEILEAGTGHGGLTIYLSRAIHAANPKRPRLSSDTNEATDEALAAWKPTRRAVVHSIEASPRYSAHAARFVKEFRRGIYYGNVDFHVGDVGDWVASALQARGNEPFLTHAFLDMPNTEKHLGIVLRALQTDATLITFNPNVSQIMEVVRTVKSENLALELDRVVELGVNGGCGGREWDVRAVVPRSKQKAATAPTEIPDGSEDDAVSEAGCADMESDTTGELQAGPVAMVCRPKVGEAVVGGGFIAVFKKHRTADDR